MLSPGELHSCLASDEVSATFGFPGRELSSCLLSQLPSDEASAIFSGTTAALSPEALPSYSLHGDEVSDLSPGGLSVGALSPVLSADGGLSADLSPVLPVASPASSTCSSDAAAVSSRIPWSGASAAAERQPPPLMPSSVAGMRDGTPPRARRGSQPSTPVSPTSVTASVPSAGASAKRMWQLDDFELGPCIGVGSFGRIVAARERQSRSVVVLKAMKKRRVERLKVQRHVAHEIEIQGHLRHPNILQLFGFFWDASHIFMILEHAHRGDLCYLLKKQPNERFSESTAAPLVAQVVSAIEYCHRMHVIHRDLKPQNVFVGHNRQVKLADFGWAVHTYPDQQRWTLCGTLDYLPPEIVHAVNGHNFGVDIWGLGVLTYELLEGCPPFSAATCEETYRLILKAPPAFTPKDSSLEEGKEDDARLSMEARDLICALLKKQPQERLPLEEALTHPWLRQSLQETVSGGQSPAAHAGA